MSEPVVVDVSVPDPEAAESERELSESDLDAVIGGIATGWIIEDD